MGKILIRGLKTLACHGVKDFEKVEKQPFVFDADIDCDFYGAYKSDDLCDTVNYSAVCKTIVSVAQNNTCDLIEKLAYECAYAVMESRECALADRIVLTVYKPNAPMKLDFGSVGATVEMERTTAYLSLGSSLGDRKGYLDNALKLLAEEKHVVVKKVSGFIETEPYGSVAKNKFLNCAAEIETLLTPRQLLKVIGEIESKCDRVRNEHWEDRTLDIDIVFFGKKVIETDDLIVPHPDYAARPFVLLPLKEIASDFICPVRHKAIKDLI